MNFFTRYIATHDIRCLYPAFCRISTCFTTQQRDNFSSHERAPFGALLCDSSYLHFLLYTRKCREEYLESRTTQRVKYLGGLSAPIHDTLSKTCAVILNSRRALVPRRNFCPVSPLLIKTAKIPIRRVSLCLSRACGDISICLLCVRKRDTRCNRANTRDHACSRRAVQSGEVDLRVDTHIHTYMHTHISRKEHHLFTPYDQVGP